MLFGLGPPASFLVIAAAAAAASAATVRQKQTKAISLNLKLLPYKTTIDNSWSLSLCWLCEAHYGNQK